ncbi:MAG: methyl-accepting chemotaxis protein [Candidatus Omnitrophota bacterium]|nr:methyl-accepting chemotaxis protein [Candidatus Omnitrophota bacterium]
MENNIPDRRKNYYIKKRFQRNFILKFLTLVVSGTLISGAIIYFMSRSTLTTTFDNSRLAIRSTADYILPSVLLSSVAAMIIVGFAAVIMTLFVSHKIAGPLYHIGKDIDTLASGNLNVRFVLRGGDEIKELASRLDDMARSLNLKAAAIRRALGDLESSSKDASPETKKNIQSLKEAISKFNVQ